MSATTLFGVPTLFWTNETVEKFSIEPPNPYRTSHMEKVISFIVTLITLLKTIRGDLILLYKILNNLQFSTTATRCHQFKLFKHHSRPLCRSQYFFNRIINDWNQLPATVVSINSTNIFKSFLDNDLIDLRFSFV